MGKAEYRELRWGSWQRYDLRGVRRRDERERALRFAPGERFVSQGHLQSPWMFGYVGLAEPNIVPMRDSVASSPSSEKFGIEWAKEHVDAIG